MNKKRLLLIALIMITGLLLASCSGSSFQTTSWPGLTLHDGELYVAYQSHIYKLNPEFGTELTRFPSESENGGPVFYSDPVFTEDGNIIAGSYSNSLLSIDTSNFYLNWTFENDNRFIAAPLVTADAIYAPNADHILYALDHNMNTLWVFETEKAIWASPITDGEYLYLVTMDHFLYVLNLQTGSIVNSLDLGGTGVSAPAMSEDGILYVSTFNSELLAIDSSNLNILWTTPLEGWGWGSPVLVDDIVYLTDLSGVLYAVDADNGTLVWRFAGEGEAPGSPLITEDSVVFSTSIGKIYNLSLDGEIRWDRSFATDDEEDVGIFGTPIQVGDLYIFGKVNSETIAFAINSNGNTQWEFTPEK
jgi:outer membrane protein assembly factor BamB